jgi:hypothetical protein
VLFKRYPMPATAGAPAPAQGKAAPADKKPASGGAAPGKAIPAGKKPAPGKAAPTRGPSGGAGKPVADAGTGQGSANGSGMLRRLTKGRPAPEPQDAVPETKLVRQQRARQSRSKRSGKR